MNSKLGNVLNEYKWFLGQVPPGQNEFVKTTKWDDAHNHRVKVRIPAMHPVSGPDGSLLKDDDLPWAIVALPTTSGFRNFQSPGIWGGEWVIGFFLDEERQIPVITHVLGNNLREYDIVSSNGTTEGKRVSRYNSGLVAGPHQMSANPGNTLGSAQPTKQEFKDAQPPVGEQTDITEERNDIPKEPVIETDSKGQTIVKLSAIVDGEVRTVNVVYPSALTPAQYKEAQKIQLKNYNDYQLSLNS